MSPLLFILDLYVLLRHIDLESQRKIVTSLRSSRNGPKTQRLVFTDDCILFLQPTSQTISRVRTILEDFLKVLGETINREKSLITFGRYTPRTIMCATR